MKLRFIVDQAILDYVQGRYREAESLLDQATEYALAETGEVDLDLLSSLNNMVSLYSALGQKEKAAALLEQMRSVLEQFSLKSPDMAYTLSNLAGVYRARDQYAEAVLLLEHALALYRRLAHAQPEVYESYVATTLSNLGAALQELGQYEAAVAAYEEALAIRRQLAHAQPEVYESYVAATLNNLGVALSDLRRYEAAVAAYEEALALYRRLAHAQPEVYESYVAATLNNLGAALQELHSSTLVPTALGWGKTWTIFVMLQESKGAISRRSVVKPYSNVPLQTIPFIPKQLEIDTLIERLNDYQCVALSGPSGIGKTQTAIAVARKLIDQGKYGCVLWISSTDILYDGAGLYLLMNDLGISTSAQNRDRTYLQSFLSWLSDNLNWLLIIDGADEPKGLMYFISQLPREGGKVLITTRASADELAKDLGLATEAIVEAQKMSQEEAVKLISYYVSKDQYHGIEEVVKLVNKLGSIPLMLRLAGAYMAKTQKSIEEYLKLYEELSHKRIEKS